MFIKCFNGFDYFGFRTSHLGRGLREVLGLRFLFTLLVFCIAFDDSGDPGVWSLARPGGC